MSIAVPLVLVALLLVDLVASQSLELAIVSLVALVQPQAAVPPLVELVELVLPLSVAPVEALLALAHALWHSANCALVAPPDSAIRQRALVPNRLNRSPTEID